MCISYLSSDVFSSDLGLQERLRVTRENADNQRETLRLVDARLDAGRGTGFYTARARAQLETTSARIPALEAQVAFDMHRLAVLVGKTPDALVAELTPTRALPELPATLAAGTPGELLRRRPARPTERRLGTECVTTFRTRWATNQ